MPPPRDRHPGRPPPPAPARGATKATSRAGATVGFDTRTANPDEILDLQRDAGNRAVTLVIQRDGRGAVDALGMPVDKNGIPIRGPDVRAELRERLPGLLGALTAEQLDRWQAVVDWHYIDNKLRSESYKNEYGYLAPQTGFPRPPDPTTHAIHQLDPAYQRRKRQLDTYGGRKRPSEDITIDPKLLLGDDVHQEPEWDVKAEMAFREWAIAEVTKQPIKVDVRPTASADKALGQWPITVKNTKGFITEANLRHEYQREYSAWVSDRQELKELQKLLGMLRDANIEMRIEHQDRSDINARKIGFGLVRHISEAFGSGSAPYPSVKMWDKADALYEKAITAFNLGQYELAVPLTAMAETTTADAVTKYLAYEKRVTSGAGRVITALEAFKTAGTIAAGVASGGLGLTGAALVAGGYQAAQEGAQRASEMYYGQRKDFGLADLLKKAGVTSVMTLMGGPLQARFQVALKARFDKTLPGFANSWFGQATISGVSSATSSVYMTAAEIAINEVVNGNAIPKSASDFADMIVDGAVQSVVMDAATNRLNSRAGREYAAWKAGRGTSTMSTSAFKHELGNKPVAPDAPTVKAAEQAVRTMPNEAVGAMLKQGAGWKQHVGELEAGVGLGRTMPVAERKALVDRFEAYRQQMAQNVVTVFGGEVAVSGTAETRHVEVKFSGPDAATRVTQAEGYLDAKSPGWRKQTDVRITAAAPIATGGPAATGTAHELQIRMSETFRHKAAGFVPIYDKLATLKTPQARAEALLEVVNRELVAAGSPPLRLKVVNDAFDGQLIPQHWEIHVSPDQFKGDLTAAKFARLCEVFAHESRHALQFWRMARIDPARSYDLDPIVKLAAEDANAGRRKAEDLDPSSLKYKEAQDHLENVYGGNAERRNEILIDMKTGLTDMQQASAALKQANDSQLPANHPDRVAAQVKYDTAKRLHDDAYRKYLAFSEEVDARQVGETTAAAVKERLGHQRTVEKAQVAEREAYATYQRAVAALAGGDFKYRHRLEKRQQLATEALAAWRKALEKVQRYEENLARLTQPMPAPTSGAAPKRAP